MAVVSVSIPDSLLDQADTFLNERGFAGRSELIRAALRDFLHQETPTATGTTSATVTLLYPHGSERKIGEIRHDYTDIIQSLMHGHAEDACVELFLLKGDAQRLRAFTDALRASRDSLLVQAVYTDQVPTPHKKSA
jgi:CopG family transcriptional regulator, nickel-responsive regulator